MFRYLLLYAAPLKARKLMILSNLHFWGWQLIIVAAAISLPLGYSTSKNMRTRMAYRYCSALIWVVLVSICWYNSKT
jgi:cytochrome c oxidase cbb3-type subunit I/II